jgi:DNA-3-methyladenine glycosylase
MNLLEKSSALKQIRPIPPQFFNRDTVQVAKDLLGKGLFVSHGRTQLLCELVEVEAYLSEEDEASHSFRGKTQKNLSMFAVGGTAYVYLIYGMYFCLNVATEEKNRGAAVLFRAAKPLGGLKEMYKNRKLSASPDPQKLLSGPGKLTQALAINKQFDGKSFQSSHFKLIDLGNKLRDSQIVSSPRIGISKARDKDLRFFIKESPWVSQKRP